MTQTDDTIVLHSEEIDGLLAQMAEKICHDNSALSDLVFVGILTNGVPISERLSKRIEETSGVKVPVGKLDVGLYRDDIVDKGSYITIRESDIPFELENKTVILVDDVLYHGRTIRAALNGILDFGRPHKINLAVLVDRGHRQLPIVADYVGKTLATDLEDYVCVRLLEVDAEDSVCLKKTR